jgi:PAS domain S-box-containing protein
MDWGNVLDNAGVITGIGASIVTILGFLYGGWKLIIKPIRKALKILDEHTKTLSDQNKIIDNDIIPVVNSIKNEFSKNGGKSIRDQLTRIEGKGYLTDARIRLIATNLVSTGIFECDGEGDCIWVNKALSELFGLDRDEMLGNGWLTSIIDSDRKRVWDEWNYAIEHRIPYEAQYTVYNRKTNKLHKCKVISMTVRDTHDVIVGYFGTVIEVPA